MKIAALTTTLLVICLSVPVFAQTSTRQDFDDFCQTWEGRWMCDRTLVVDEPGSGKKGDKFTEYADCKIEHDGNAMICKSYGGKGNATWIVVYEAGDKKIKGFWVTSGGVVSHSVIYKRGDKWVEVASGSQPDGTKVEISFTVTITDEGKTHTWKGTSTVGEEKTAEDVTVWHRVNK